MSRNTYGELFKPAKIGTMELKNRICMAPMEHKYFSGNTEDSSMTHQQVKVFEARAKGGCGLIFTSATHAEQELMPYPRDMGFPVIDRKERIKEFAEAAGRLKEAGFDALLVMGGGGYLINQFLSPAWNQRTDEYGGSVEKRMTFLIETLQETKKIVGEKYPIIVSLNMDDLLPKGVAPCRGMIVEETIATAQKLEELGLADAFHLRIGNYYNQEYIVPSAYVTNEEYMKNFRKFKAAVTKPVIFENKLDTPEEMQQLLEEGVLDFASVGRKWIADPEWVNKAMYGKKARPCLRCNYCLHTLWLGKRTQCALNPEMGHEFEGGVQPATEKKRITVIGAGPGGIQAALTAAKRGHHVTLLEKEQRIGGKLDIVSAPSYKKQYLDYISYLEDALAHSTVELKLGVDATLKHVQATNPDAVIVATGADPLILPIPGIDHAVTADSVLRGQIPVHGTVVIIGGGLVGCETAHVLAEQGCKVHIVEMQDDVLKDTSYVTRHSQLDMLASTGAKLHVNTRLMEILEDGILATHNGETVKLSADAVVLAMGYRNFSTLYTDLLDNLDCEVYQIGDCRQTRKIANAIQEGHIIAKNL